MANADSLVTVVRKRVILEEVVMTQREFNEMNKSVKNEESEWSELNWEESGFEDYNESETYYTAFPGNITSFTDDCVTWKYADVKWVSCGDKVKLNHSLSI